MTVVWWSGVYFKTMFTLNIYFMLTDSSDRVKESMKMSLVNTTQISSDLLHSNLTSVFKLSFLSNTFIYENKMKKISGAIFMYLDLDFAMEFLILLFSLGVCFMPSLCLCFLIALIFITFSHTSAPLSLLSMPINATFSVFSCVFSMLKFIASACVFETLFFC